MTSPTCRDGSTVSPRGRPSRTELGRQETPGGEAAMREAQFSAADRGRADRRPGPADRSERGNCRIAHDRSRGRDQSWDCLLCIRDRRYTAGPSLRGISYEHLLQEKRLFHLFRDNRHRVPRRAIRHSATTACEAFQPTKGKLWPLAASGQPSGSTHLKEISQPSRQPFSSNKAL